MRWQIVAGALAVVAGALVGADEACRDAAAEPAASARRREGTRALLAGRLAEAEALYQQALAAPAPATSIWFDLCLVRYAAGDFGRAINACYRALDADEDRAVRLLQQIAAGMSAAGISASGVVLPEPARAWFDPEKWLPGQLEHAKVDPQGAGGVRVAAADPAAGPVADPIRAPSSFDVIDASQVDRLRGAAPPLPYAIPAPRTDYSSGYDLSLRTGILLYAPDTTPAVTGARVEVKRHVWGALAHEYYFGEYLHALDGTGGIGAFGYGLRTGGPGNIASGSVGLAVPWGRSEGRRDVLIPDHTLALHVEVRVGVHHEMIFGRSLAVSFEGSAVAGLNPAKALFRLDDFCYDGERNCSEDEPDANASWPLGHVMLQLGVSFGRRSDYAPYARTEVFAPMGRP